MYSAYDNFAEKVAFIFQEKPWVRAKLIFFLHAVGLLGPQKCVLKGLNVLPNTLLPF